MVKRMGNVSWRHSQRLSLTVKQHVNLHPRSELPLPSTSIAMPLRTKRWNDPIGPEDGFRLLICRYRPRGLKKAKETWQLWWKNLGPSVELHADYYGKNGPP